MGNFSGKWFNWRGNKQPQNSTFELPIEGDIGDLLGQAMMGRLSASACLKYYSSCNAVGTPIDLVAESIAQLKVTLKVDGKCVTDHPILELLNAPHTDYDSYLFKKQSAIYYMCTGKTYILAEGNYKYPPFGICAISPAVVGIEQNQNGFLGYLNVSGEMYAGQYKRKEEKNNRIFLRDNFTQIKQIRDFSVLSNSQLDGDSKLNAALLDVVQNINGGKHNAKTLLKGGRLTLLFSIKDEMNPNKFEEAKRRIINTYSGNNGASIGVIDGAQTDVKEFGKSNKDMDYVNLHELTKKAIAMRFAVPSVLVSDDDATYNNLATAYTALYDNAVIPTAKRFYDGVGDLLFPRFGLDPSRTEFDFDLSRISALATRQAEVAVKRRATGLYKEDELRELDSLNPLGGDDGDRIWMPTSYQPVDSLADKKPSTGQLLNNNDEDY